MDRKRWKSISRCVEGMLSSFAVIGFGLAMYEQQIWPALAIGTTSAITACLIAWSVNHD